ncbi:MAG: hypothetical protein LBB94_08630, partial [Clostridiales bacterium]|nr:hypothetical protein [Clostridiales bacterium]
MAVIGVTGGQSHETARCLHRILEDAGVSQSFSVVDLERAEETPRVDILTAAGGGDIAQRLIEEQEKLFFIMNPDQKDI